MNSKKDQLPSMLEKWEEVHKRGLLSFWLLLLLSDHSAYPREIGEALSMISQKTISVDEFSIYRALSRFEGMGIVASEFKQSDQGPPRKYYKLNEKGLHLLAEFIRRNILVFDDPSVRSLIQSVLASAQTDKVAKNNVQGS